MKTVRFTNLVQKFGKPENHLVLVNPLQDKTLQRAVKETRVLTVHQPTVGMKAEHGEVGFAPGSSRQFFIFSKSLKSFEGKRVVGIKYDDLETNEKAPAGPKSRNSRSKGAVKSPVKKRVSRSTEGNEVPKHKVVQFPEQEREDAESHENSEIIEELKSQVRRAMNALEEGKQVAAFNLLKTIVEH